VRDHTAAGDRRFDERVEFLVTTDGQVQMAGGDALHFQILRCIAGKLEHFSGEVFENGGRVDGGRGADTSVRCSALLEEPMDTTDGEL